MKLIFSFLFVLSIRLLMFFTTVTTKKFCICAVCSVITDAESAATLFLASHSEELLKQFCNRGVVFSHGSIAYDGPLDAALNYYHTHDYYRKNVIG